MTQFQNHKQRSLPSDFRKVAWRLAIFHTRRSVVTRTGLLMLGLISAGVISLFFRYDAAIAATSVQTTIATEVPASVVMNRQQPAWLEAAVAAAPAAPPTQRPADSALEPPPLANSVAAAPSRLWLIAMPAVPVLGGIIIYSLRKLSGKL